jgi:hypothetical protein
VAVWAAPEKGFKSLTFFKVCWNTCGSQNRSARSGVAVLISLLLISFLTPNTLLAQSLQPADPVASNTDNIFRIERVPVAGGAELITIHARLDGLTTPDKTSWVPLVSVLRDTLGDTSPENDRLRYVWPLTYTRPTVRQKISGAIPFLYTRVGNRKSSSEKSPPPILDLADTNHYVWNRIFWSALQTLLLDPYGMPIKASTRSYRQNIGDYRKSHIIRALSVLSLYQAVGGESAFSDSELSEIQARLKLTDNTFGGFVGDLNLKRYNEQQVVDLRDTRGHNWELLRQRAEAESLYFEPLQMPDGSMTHALLWVAQSDLAAHQDKRYEKRFLNIASPWSDKRLLNWEGYTETRFLDADGRLVGAVTPGARATDMIPLALYGLDNPRIPMLLVDFRDGFNPKKREMSRRVLQDVTKNILSVSGFGDLPYFLGRTVFDFVTGRRGMDVNQPSRLRTYSQLKLLLALNQSMDPELRKQIGGRLERVSLNPLENDLEAEARIATEQYQNLLAYANRPDGLPAKLNRDRRTELVPLQHSHKEQVLFRVGNILSFGRYTHREKETPEMEAQLDAARRLSYHTEFLQEVAGSGPQVDIVWNLDEVKRSLAAIGDHGANAGARSASVVANIFLRTQDTETRRHCLETLARINSPKARAELEKLSRDKSLDQAGRDLVTSYLISPVQGEPVIVLSDKASGARSDH